MKLWRRIRSTDRKTKNKIVVQLSPEDEIRLRGGIPLPPIPKGAKPVPRNCPRCGKPLERKGDVPICGLCSLAWCPRCGTKLFGRYVTQCHKCHVAWCFKCFCIPAYYVRHRFGTSMACCGLLGEQIVRGVK